MMEEITFTDCSTGYGVTSLVRNNAPMIKTPVKLAIELTDMTGEELADKLGISAPHVSRLRTGKSPTTTDVISKLAEICGITVSEFYRLLAGDEEVRSQAARNVAGTEPDEPLQFKPQIFDLAVEETRRLDAMFANGQAQSKNFSTLMHAIYKFIDAEGIEIDSTGKKRELPLKD